MVLLIEDISAPALAHRLSGQDRPVLLDVREAWERGLARVEPSLHIPMADVPDRLSAVAPVPSLANTAEVTR